MKSETLRILISETKKIIESASDDQKNRIFQKLINLKEYTERKKQEKSQEKSVDNSIDVSDPELDYLMNFAKKHYPSSKTKQAAFYKYIQRALSHSEENDNMQNDEIDQIWREIESIKKALQQKPTKTDFVQES